MDGESEQNQNVTALLRRWSAGEKEALERLLPLVYDELRRQAARALRRERAGHTLQTGALVNEAYLKMVEQKEIVWNGREHFYAIAANVMRQILIDYARRKNRQKRGGADVRITLDEKAAAGGETSLDLIALDQALTRLEKIDGRQARLVELKFFSGLTLEETAAVLKISRATAAREWTLARAWLFRELTR